MTPQRQFPAAIGGLVVLTAVGVACYMLREGRSVCQALYRGAISLSTAGVREAPPLSPAGEWFTIAFVVLGFAVAGVTAFLVEGDLRSLLKGHRVDRQLTQLRDHYILCGRRTGNHLIALGTDAQLREPLDLAREAS